MKDKVKEPKWNAVSPKALYKELSACQAKLEDLRNACNQKQEIIDSQKDYAKISLELEALKFPRITKIVTLKE